MILIDASIWIEYFRWRANGVAFLLRASRVLMHPFVIGEIALGNVGERAIIMSSLLSIRNVTMATDPEVLAFIDASKLGGSGIGYVDAHLLASVRLTAGAALWTGDKRLATVAAGLGLAARFAR